MDVVEYFTKKSKEEALKDEEIKGFNDELNTKLDRINNLRVNTRVFEKIKHPFRTIKTAVNYLELSKIKKDFDKHMNSSVLLYDNGDNGELIEDLEGAASFYKPQFIKKYVRSQSDVLKRIK